MKIIEKTKGGGGQKVLIFSFKWHAGGRGATQHPNIYSTFFCDNRLLIEDSNRLMSHY